MAPSLLSLLYLQKVLLEVPEPELELALQLEEVGALLVDVGALRLEDLQGSF